MKTKKTFVFSLLTVLSINTSLLVHSLHLKLETVLNALSIKR